MDARALPSRASLEQYKKQAKDLLKACKSSDPDAIHGWALAWVQSRVDEWMVTEAQLRGVPVAPPTPEMIASEVNRVAGKLRSSLSKTDCTLAGAQFFIARSHGFESWPKFAKHLQGLTRPTSADSRFEAAVDCIISGDVATLEQLLHEDPELIRARSTREHSSTLLHYVSANGVEDFRQKTPQNIVDVTKILLRAGGPPPPPPPTTLGLVATSIHPVRAGVQIALMTTLLEAGASVDGAPGAWTPLLGALQNGRPEAASFLAGRGARLDLEGAAGVGRLDLVRTLFDSATRTQIESGLMWACEYGQTSVVGFLLDHGVDAGTNVHGMTGLHWAAVGGQLDTIKLLIARHAPLEARNAYGGTVLGCATWAVMNSAPINPWLDANTDWVAILQLLIEAGARIDEADYPTGNEGVDQLLRRMGAGS
jgi:ankyrin repeat protein